MDRGVVSLVSCHFFHFVFDNRISRYWSTGEASGNGPVKLALPERANRSFREFDPGSERTLAACLTHASRARKSRQRDEYSGERVSNAWVIYPSARDTLLKGGR